MRKLVVAALAVVSVALAGCGDDPQEPNEAGVTGVSGQVEDRTVVAAGPPLLPPLDSELLVGLPVEMVLAPDDVEPLPTERADAGPGQLALYGDPAAEDPLAGPWVLAVLHQGSENSGLGGPFDPRGTGTEWTDVPVEQLGQESRYGGLLTSGLDASTVTALADGASVSGDDMSEATIEIPPAVLDDQPETLRLITSGAIDVAAVGSAWERGTVAPTVRWDEQREYPEPSRRLSVTSYEASPGLELLLRATNGGPAVGPSVMPVGSAPPDNVVIGVRTIGDTTVLVQSVEFDAEQVETVLDSLRPATEEDWAALASGFRAAPPMTMVPDPDVLVTGAVFDGTYSLEIGIDTVETPFGPTQMCSTSVSVAFPGGTGGGGDLSSGPCSSDGSVGVIGLSDRDGTIVHGEVPPSVSTVRLTLAGGQVLEPPLTGDQRRAFVAGLEGRTAVTSVETFGADGGALATAPGDTTGLVGAPGSSTVVSLVPTG